MADPFRGSADDALDLTPSEAEAVLALLAAAPPEAARWAAHQKAALEQVLVTETVSAQEANPEPKPEPEPEEDEDGQANEDDDFYDDMEDDDDVLRDLRIKAKRRRAAKPAASTEASAALAAQPTAQPAGQPTVQQAAGYTNAAGQAPTQRRPKLSAGAWVILAVVLAFGVGFGIWYAGRPAEQTSTTPQMSTEEEADSGDVLDRMIGLEQAIEADPDDLDARLELGVLRFNLADVEGAKEQWEYVADKDPENVSAWYNLGFAYLSETPSNREAANAAWLKVIELDPDSDLAETISMHIQGLNEMEGNPAEEEEG